MNATEYPACQILDDDELHPQTTVSQLDWSKEPVLGRRTLSNRTTPHLNYKATLLMTPPTPVRQTPTTALQEDLSWLTPMYIATYGVPLMPLPLMPLPLMDFQPIQPTADDEDPPYAPMTPPQVSSSSE